MSGLSDEDIRIMLANPALQPPTARHMPFELLRFSVDEGWAEMTFEPDMKFANPGGSLHGGFICAILDDAMAVAAAISQRGQGFVPLLQINVTFIKAVPIGKVMARGEVLRIGSSAGQMRAELRVEPHSPPFAIAAAVGVPRSFAPPKST